MKGFANMDFFDSEMFTFVVLPVLIFLARVCDVTLGTIRIIFVSRGAKVAAPILGFIEILIWLVAIGKVMQNLTNIGCYLGYAAGFAAGNLVGILLEERLAMGNVVIRVITNKEASELINSLRTAGYGATSIPAQGGSGTVSVIYSVIKRSDLNEVVAIIKEFNPNAFYSIEDVRYVSKGTFPLRRPIFHTGVTGLFNIFRKGK
jgi:uncharacterized protein YebE (UPF0316 family)